MVKALKSQQVVAFPAEHRVVLLPRAARGRETKGKQSYGYHAFQNPAGRRTGDAEWKIMIQDVASGRLRRACEELAQEWDKTDVDITYVRALQISGHWNLTRPGYSNPVPVTPTCRLPGYWSGSLIQDPGALVQDPGSLIRILDPGSKYPGYSSFPVSRLAACFEFPITI
jgi:hypothetical protein